MNNENFRKFGLAITEYTDTDGIPRYSVKSKSFGIPTEAILVVLQNWLKLNKDSYHEDFLRRK